MLGKYYHIYSQKKLSYQTNKKSQSIFLGKGNGMSNVFNRFNIKVYCYFNFHVFFEFYIYLTFKALLPKSVK